MLVVLRNEGRHVEEGITSIWVYLSIFSVAEYINMNKKIIAIILGGIIVLGVGVGVGISLGLKDKNKQSKQDYTNSNSVVKNEDTQPETPNENKKEINEALKKQPEVKKEEVKKEEPKKEEIKTEPKQEENTGMCYPLVKDNVTKADILKVKEAYENEMSDFSIYYGKYYVKNGDILFSDDPNENNPRLIEFYNKSDKMLNNLWKGLESILSEREFKKLTQEQVQWIKTKDSIEKGATEFASAHANTMYARGKETVKRCRYLYDAYFDIIS